MTRGSCVPAPLSRVIEIGTALARSQHDETIAAQVTGRQIAGGRLVVRSSGQGRGGVTTAENSTFKVRTVPSDSTTTRPGSIDRTTKSLTCAPSFATTGFAFSPDMKIARLPDGPVITPARRVGPSPFRTTSSDVFGGRRSS